MNKDLFHAMQKQLSPSEDTVSRLKEQLSQPNQKRPARWKYGAVAACAALALAAVPIYQHLQTPDQPSLHSYVVNNASALVHTELAAAGGGQYIDFSGSGHADDGPAGAKPIDEPIVDAPADEEADRLYGNLMARFEADCGPNAFPEWYGGSYLAGNGQLMVLIVEEFEPQDKGLYLQLFDWAGGDSIGFGSAKYSLNHLRDLQEQLGELPEMRLITGWACGVHEMENRLVLDIPEASPALLAALAKLDPEDDAILVRTGITITPTADQTDAESPASHPVKPPAVRDPDGDAPASSSVPGTVQDAIAHYDILPEELPQAKYGQDTSSYDPGSN